MDSPFAYGLLAFAHLVGVMLALPSITWRGLSLSRVQDDPAVLASVLRADNVWGLSALVVLPTGLYRLLVLGKGWPFYVNNPFFLTKMALFGLVFVLEVWPMAVLIRHRLAAARGGTGLGAAQARTFARISFAQAVLLVAALFCAPMMARGVGQLG